MLLSIIIPAYNAANYLDHCLSGLICNSKWSYEVIVINDGSTDQTSQVIASYAAKYPFIHYIEQSNSGVSAARNAGINAAAGKYLTFLDADDELLALPDILEALSSSEYDLLIGDFHEVRADGSIARSRELSESIADNREALEKELLGGYLLNTCWGKFYLTDIIRMNNIIFPLGVKMGEDLIFVLQYLHYVRDFYCLPLYIYNYLQLDSGAVRRLRNQITPELIHNKVLCIQAKNTYMDCHSLSDELVAEFYRYQLADIISTINMMLKSGSKLSEEYQSMQSFVTTPEIRALLETSAQHIGISSKRRFLAFVYLHKLPSFIYITVKHMKNRLS